MKRVPLLFFIVSLGWVLETVSMQKLQVRLRDEERSIALPLKLKLLSAYQSNLDGTLSYAAWQVIIEMHNINTHIKDQNDTELTLTTNPFDFYQVAPLDAEKVMEVLHLLLLSPSVNNALIEAYVLFTKGQTNPHFLGKMQEHFRPALDSFFFMYFDHHLAQPPIGPINIQSLLAKSPKFKEVLEKGALVKPLSQVASCYPDASAVDQNGLVLLLNKWSLTSLKGLDELLAHAKLEKNQIVLIDLRNNRLASINRTDLESFSNLKALYVSGNAFGTVGDISKKTTSLFIDISTPVIKNAPQPLARIAQPTWRQNLSRSVSKITDSDIVVFAGVIAFVCWMYFKK